MDILTENAIKELHTNESAQSLHGNYRVQILSLKSFGPEIQRYRTVISDGTHYMHALIPKSYATLVETGHLVKYSIIRLTEATMSCMSNRRILVLLEFEVLSNYPLTPIGSPVNIGYTGFSGQNTSTSLQQPIQQLQQPVQQLQQPVQQLQQPVQQLQQPSQRLQQPSQWLHYPIQQPTHQTRPPSFHQIEQSTPQRIQQQPIQQLGRPIHQPAMPIQQPLLMQNSGSSSHPSEFSDRHPESSLFTIHCLNPYRNRWTIKARVVQKSDIKTWANSRTEGKLFNVNLLDKTGEIKATAFQKEVDRLYSIMVEGQVYYISNARVVVAKKQFSTLDNEYELTLEHNTDVEWCADDPSIPDMNYSFTKISDIGNKEKNDTVDVIGVVRKDNGLTDIISKSTGAPSKKRELYIVDETQKEIRVSIWGRIAENFDSSGFPVVAFKGLKVSDFGGRVLSLQLGGAIKMNPNIPEAHVLQSWHRDHGQQAVYSGFTNTLSTSDGLQFPGDFPKLTIADAKYKYNLGEHETADFFAVRGTIMYIKTESYCYPACPECSKKLILEESLWRCEKCSLVHSAPKYKYVLSFSIEDDTSHLYVTAFDKVAERLLQKTATELTQLSESHGYDHLQMSAFDLPKYKVHNFKIRAEQRVYNDIPSTQFVVLEATSVDFVKEGRHLGELIESCMASPY